MSDEMKQILVNQIVIMSVLVHAKSSDTIRGALDICLTDTEELVNRKRHGKG